MMRQNKTKVGLKVEKRLGALKWREGQNKTKVGLKELW